jgi:hypothetical protein
MSTRSNTKQHWPTTGKRFLNLSVQFRAQVENDRQPADFLSSKSFNRVKSATSPSNARLFDFCLFLVRARVRVPRFAFLRLDRRNRSIVCTLTIASASPPPIFRDSHGPAQVRRPLIENTIQPLVRPMHHRY